MQMALPKRNTETTALVGTVFVRDKEYVVRLKRTVQIRTLERSRLFDIFPMSWGRYKPGVDVIGEKVPPEQGGKMNIVSEQVACRATEDGIYQYNDMGSTLPKCIFYQPMPKTMGE